MTSRMTSRRWLMRVSLVAVAVGTGTAIGHGAAAAGPTVEVDTSIVVGSKSHDSERLEDAPSSLDQPDARAPADDTPLPIEPVAPAQTLDHKTTKDVGAAGSDGSPDVDSAPESEEGIVAVPAAAGGTAATATEPVTDSTTRTTQLNNSAAPSHSPVPVQSAAGHTEDIAAAIEPSASVVLPAITSDTLPVPTDPPRVAAIPVPTPTVSVEKLAELPVQPTEADSAPSVLGRLVDALLDITEGLNKEDGGRPTGPPVEGLWLAARDLQARTSAFRSSSRTKGSESVDSAELTDDVYSFILDPTTGAVIGTINVLTPDGVDPVYVAINAPDPSIGDFSLNSATGTWSFTPTSQLRRLAATSDDDDVVVNIHILAGAGESITRVEMAVPILPIVLAPTSEHVVESSTGTVHGMIAIPGGAVGDPIYIAINAPDPALGSFTIDTATGAWSFTPTSALRDLAAQSSDENAFDVTFLVGDSLGVASVTVAVPITPSVNVAPTVSSDPAQTTVDPTSGSVKGQINASDPENDSLVFVALNAPDPALGTFALESNTGRWTFTPSTILRDLAAQTSGDDAFGVTVVVSDGTSEQSIVVNVPVASSFSESVPLIDDIPFVATTDSSTGSIVGSVNFSSPGGAPLTYVVTGSSGPTLGLIDINSTTGAFVYTPSLRALTAAWRSPSGTLPASFTVTASTPSGLSATTTVTVPIGVSSEALLQLLRQYESHPSAVAVDSDGVVYVVNSGAGRLSIIDPLTRAVKAVVAVGKLPTAVAVDAENRAWVANSGDGTVTVVSNGNAIKTIVVGSGPSGIVFDSDGTAFVSNAGSDTVTVIGSSLAVQKTVSVGKTPTGIAIDADGIVFTSNFGDGTISVVDMNNLVPCTSFFICYAGASDSIPLAGVNPYRIAIDSGGALYVTDPTRHNVTRLTRPAEQASRAAQLVGHDASTSWSLQGDSKTVTSTLEASTFTAETYVVLGSPTSITAGADGTIYVANGSGNTITEILWNVGSKNIKVGARPTGIAVGVAGTLYVSNGDSNTLSVLDGPLATQIGIGIDTYHVSTGLNGELVLSSIVTNDTKIIQADQNSTVGQNSSTHFTSQSDSVVLAVGPDGRIFTDSQPYFANGGYIYGYNDAGDIVSSGFTLAGLLKNGDTSLSHAVLRIASDGTYYLLTSGLLYVGHDGPIDPLSPTRSIAFERVEPGIPADDLVIGTDNLLYIAQGARTLTVLNRTDLSVVATISIPVEETRDSRLSNLILGLDGNIYATTNFGAKLHIIDTSDYSVRTVTPTAGVSSVAAGADGRIYLGTYGGVSVLDQNLVQVAFVRIGEDTPTKVVFGTDGRVYIVGATVYVLDPTNYSIGTVSLSSNTANSIRPRDAVAGGGGVYILSSSCSLSNCSNQINQVGLAGSLTENGLGVRQAVARLANIARIAAVTTTAPADVVNDYLDDPLVGLVATLAGIAEDIQVIQTAGVEKGFPVLGLLTILDKFGSLKEHLPGIAAGNPGDFIRGLADVAAIAVAVGALAVTMGALGAAAASAAPAALTFLAIASLAITGLEFVLNAGPA